MPGTTIESSATAFALIVTVGSPALAPAKLDRASTMTVSGAGLITSRKSADSGYLALTSKVSWRS